MIEPKKRPSAVTTEGFTFQSYRSFFSWVLKKDWFKKNLMYFLDLGSYTTFLLPLSFFPFASSSFPSETL